MLFHKAIDQRNHVVISHGYASVVFHIFIADLSLIIHDQLRGIAVTVHVMIIAYIILREDKRRFPGRKKDLSLRDVPVVICLCHVLDAYHHIALVIHDLRDLVKLINSCHDLIIICFFVISVKRFGWIFDQNMIKNMCHLFKGPCRTGCFYVFVFFCSRLHLLIRIIGRSLFQKIDSFVIVILTGQKLCLCESIFGNGLCIFSTRF